MPEPRVGFVGLGRMGGPMTARLLDAGFAVRGFDVAETARDALAAAGGTSAGSAADVATDAGAVVLMLPDSGVVESVLVDGGLLAACAPGTVVVDMSSSVPARTRELAQRAEAAGVAYVDAPVSGGVSGAESGALTIMAGGEDAPLATVTPVLEALGKRVLHVGGVGAGHAVKALNNLLSATSLLASSEALEIGRRFGLDPETMIDAINTSSGRSFSTEHKLPSFVIPESYTSGFALDLMLKDMRIALELADDVGAPTALTGAAEALWAQAAAALGPGVDHTEVGAWARTETTTEEGSTA